MIASLATSERVAYLPVHERQVVELMAAKPEPRPYEEMGVAGFLATGFQRRMLGRTLDTNSKRRGLVLTVDHVHQNSRGAALIAELVNAGLLRERRPDHPPMRAADQPWSEN